MSTVRIVIVAAALLVSSLVPGHAGETDEPNIELLLNTIRANKRALVEASLTLTDEEAERFWPVYDRYQAQLAGVNERLVALIEEYTDSFGDLSNEKALKLIGEYLTVEVDRAKIRRENLDPIAKVLPGRKVARFFQIENKMDAVVRYDLAAGIPVLDE